MPLDGHHYLSWTFCIELEAAVGRAGRRARSNCFYQRRKIPAMAAKTHIYLPVLNAPAGANNARSPEHAVPVILNCQRTVSRTAARPILSRCSAKGGIF